MPAVVVRVVTYFVKSADLNFQLFCKLASYRIFEMLSRFSMATGQSPFAFGLSFYMMVNCQEEPVFRVQDAAGGFVVFCRHNFHEFQRVSDGRRNRVTIVYQDAATTGGDYTTSAVAMRSHYCEIVVPTVGWPAILNSMKAIVAVS
jgi:hypothetical protein